MRAVHTLKSGKGERHCWASVLSCALKSNKEAAGPRACVAHGMSHKREPACHSLACRLDVSSRKHKVRRRLLVLLPVPLLALSGGDCSCVWASRCGEHCGGCSGEGRYGVQRGVWVGYVGQGEGEAQRRLLLLELFSVLAASGSRQRSCVRECWGGIVFLRWKLRNRSVL